MARRKPIPVGAIVAADKAVHTILAQCLLASMGGQQKAYSNKGELFITQITKINASRPDMIEFTLNITNTEETSWNVRYTLDPKRGNIWQEE